MLTDSAASPRILGWRGLGICWSHRSRVDPCLKVPLLVQVSKRQQRGLRDAADGEERDADVSGMRSPPVLGLVEEGGTPAGSTLTGSVIVLQRGQGISPLSDADNLALPVFPRQKLPLQM